MEFLYGHGVYLEGHKKFEGRIILSEYKLFLKDANKDLPQTYIPLDKVKRIRRVRGGVKIDIKPTLYFQYSAIIKSEKGNILSLIDDIVRLRRLKKSFFINEWVDRSL